MAVPGGGYAVMLVYRLSCCHLTIQRLPREALNNIALNNIALNNIALNNIALNNIALNNIVLNHSGEKDRLLLPYQHGVLRGIVSLGAGHQEIAVTHQHQHNKQAANDRVEPQHR